jgi:hypothetical protein
VSAQPTHTSKPVGDKAAAGGKNKAVKPNATASANNTAASHTTCHEWRYNLSPQRPSHGSTTASMLRLSKSTAPKAASVTPYCWAYKLGKCT